MPKTAFVQNLGKYGEKVAQNFLIAKGYRLLRENYRIPGGQIDLIMYSPRGNLIFVEVKTRAARSFRPARGGDYRLGGAQIRALTRAARQFLSLQSFPFVTWQLDLIWINLEQSGVNDAIAKIKHFQNILEI
jgi:putative endonuclease